MTTRLTGHSLLDYLVQAPQWQSDREYKLVMRFHIPPLMQQVNSKLVFFPIIHHAGV